MEDILFSRILFSENLEQLLICFFNININYDSIDDIVDDFTIEGSFKQSKYSTIPFDKENLFLEVSKNLTKYYQMPFSQKKNGYICTVKNDLQYTYKEIINALRNKILVQISRFPNVLNIDSVLAKSIYILRGSPDFNRRLIAVDILRPNKNDIYIDSMYRILNVSNELINYLNWNFRDLQQDYVTGKNKRNIQLRLNLNWYYKNVASSLEDINRYKYKILIDNTDKIGLLDNQSKISENFIKRVQFYRLKILNNDLTELDIKEIRNDLFGENNSVPTRKQRVVSTVKNLTDDVCCACHTTYPIEDRSFIVPRDNRYYFEYHHVIPFSSNRNMVDIVENVVKLCPTCHRAMTKNRAAETLQTKLIYNILKTREDVYGFTSSYYKQNNMLSTAQLIQKSLV